MPRPTTFPKKWMPLLEAYGGSPYDVARELGVSHKTLWRWASKGDAIGGPQVIALRSLAEARGVKSPV